MRITRHTEPGQRGGTNLDAVELGLSWVIVADGVTPTPGPSGCRHGTHWYTTTVVAVLADLLDTNPSTALPDLARAAITVVADSHRDTCDLTHPQHPSAMLAVLREHPGGLDYLVIGDVLVLIEADDAVRSITDGRPDALPCYTAAFVRGRRNAPGGFVVAAADPEVVDRAVFGTVPPGMAARAAVMSDGAARLSDRFGQLDHAQLLDLVEFAGPARVVARVRDAERDETAAELARRRGKAHDDATAVMVQLFNPRTAGVKQLLDRAATLKRRLREAVDIEVWCGMVAALAEVLHTLANRDERTRGARQRRREAHLLSLLARGVFAGAMNQPVPTAGTWLPPVPEALMLRYNQDVAALSAAHLTTVQCRLVERFAERVRADPDDAAAGEVIEQIARTYLLAVRQRAHGRRPHSTDESLLNRIAAQRVRCTGENPDDAAKLLAPLVRAFAADQREAVDAALRHGFQTRLLGAGTPLVDAQIRNAVLPPASTPQQQRLEALVLLALGQALTHSGGSHVGGPTVTPVVNLGVDGTLGLVLPQHVGGAFLRALLGGASGVRGHARQRGMLVWLTEDNSATVHVRGISWETVRGAGTGTAVPTGSILGPDHPDRAAPGPGSDARAGVATAREAYLSDLLRRIGSVGGATSLAIADGDGDGDVTLSWRAGRDVATVACELVHPLTGLAGDEFQVVRRTQHDGHDVVRVRAASAGVLLTLRREEAVASRP